MNHDIQSHALNLYRNTKLCHLVCSVGMSPSLCDGLPAAAGEPYKGCNQ